MNITSFSANKMIELLLDKCMFAFMFGNWIESVARRIPIASPVHAKQPDHWSPIGCPIGLQTLVFLIHASYTNVIHLIEGERISRNDKIQIYHATKKLPFARYAAFNNKV